MLPITPEDVRNYTAFEEVKARTDEQLNFDILQGAQDIYAYVGHKFDETEYPTIPDTVKLAFIKMAEYYALANSDSAIAKGYVSEKIGNYSYQIGNNELSQRFSLSTLLDGHVKIDGDSRFRFRLRAF